MANKLGWPAVWLPKISDYEVHIEVDGIKVIGRGTDKNSELAFVKACAESVERFICVSNDIGSNGVAIHTNKEKAIEGAKKELVERFVMKYLLSNNIPMNDVALEGLEQISRKFSDNQSEIRFKQIRVNGLNVVLACISKGELETVSSLYLGFGCNEILSLACEKALTESLINYVAFEDESQKEINNSNLFDISSNGFKPVYNNKTEIKKVIDFINSSNIDNRIYLLDESKIKTTQLSVESNIINGMELYAFRAVAADGDINITAEISSKEGLNE